MLPIHLAIGIVEGLITAAVVSFVWRVHPETLILGKTIAPAHAHSHKPLFIGLALFALVAGGVLSWFASTHPDGLEWSMKGTSGKEELEAPKEGVHGALARIQERLAFLPGYDFKKPEEGTAGKEGEKAGKGEAEESWPAVSTGTSLSGIVGAALTLLLAGAVGLVLRRFYSPGRGEA